MSRASQKKSFCAAIRGIHPTISFIFSVRSCNVWQLWIWLRVLHFCWYLIYAPRKSAPCLSPGPAVVYPSFSAHPSMPVQPLILPASLGETCFLCNSSTRRLSQVLSSLNSLLAGSPPWPPLHKAPDTFSVTSWGLPSPIPEPAVTLPQIYTSLSLCPPVPPHTSVIPKMPSVL
uniref:cDNA FLJ57411 n=1 Tax=Homo sapiens TaxID=9606 RepID=B4DP74_HUMAN|nr:unnamed protein product [Homo sapiens]